MPKIHLKKNKIVVFSPKLKVTLNYSLNGYFGSFGPGIDHLWESSDQNYSVVVPAKIFGFNQEFGKMKWQAEKLAIEFLNEIIIERSAADTNKNSKSQHCCQDSE